MTKQTTLKTDWWIRQRLQPDVNSALRRAFAEHCFTVIDNTLDGRTEYPATVLALTEGLGLNSTGGYYRKRNGESSISFHDILALATLLDLVPANLVPQMKAWLVSATFNICEREQTLKSCEHFVEYTLCHFLKYRLQHQNLDEFFVDNDCLSESAQVLSVDVEEMRKDVQQVAKFIEDRIQNGEPK